MTFDSIQVNMCVSFAVSYLLSELEKKYFCFVLFGFIETTPNILVEVNILLREKCQEFQGFNPIDIKIE